METKRPNGAVEAESESAVEEAHQTGTVPHPDAGATMQASCKRLQAHAQRREETATSPTHTASMDTQLEGLGPHMPGVETPLTMDASPIGNLL